jgi:putative peptidoglycan lipid II flippase
VSRSPGLDAPLGSRVRRGIPSGRLANVALLLSASFVLSRLLGLTRTVIIADIFGERGPIEAYFAAFRIPDTMFMLVSGGALASAFIPIFAGLLQTDREREAWRVASTVFNTIAMALAALAVIFFALAPQLMGFLTGGFTSSQEHLTVDLTRIMLLQPIFLGLAALLSGILQTYHRFVLTALSPLFYNVVVVIGALLGHRYGTVGLAWSVVLGAAAQVVVLVPGLTAGRLGRLQLSLDWDLPAARDVMRLFVPRMVGLAAFQAMLFITLYLASRLPHGMVGAINYSWLLIAFPVGALGTAAATAMFPTLSRLSASDELETMAGTINRSLRFTLFLAIPASAGLVVLRRPVINLLYFHGAWTPQATEQTAHALLFYSMAIAPLAAIEILPRVFYAMRDTLTPVRIAVFAVLLDAVLSIVFVKTMPRDQGQGGLALATVIATTLQAALLARAMTTQLRDVGSRDLVRAIRDALCAGLAMALVLYVLLQPLSALLPQNGFGAFVTVGVEVAVGAATFAWFSYLLGAPELWQLDAIVRRRH